MEKTKVSGIRQGIEETKFFLERLYQIFYLIFKYSFKLKDAPEVRFRMFFEEAGGAFLKFGQILALRYDLLPYHYTKELLSLLSNVPQAPLHEMEAIFARDFGKRPQQFFLEFNEMPVATASIGQVYRARLQNGEQVAVKIKRPGVDRTFETDFALASFISGLVSIFNFLKIEQINDAVSEFIAWTRRELNFLNEGKNGNILCEHSKSHPRTIIPKIYLDISTENVLISQFMEDIISVDKIIKNLDENPNYRQELLEEYNIDLTQMAKYFIADGMRQYFIDGFFHADPHPANLFLGRNNTLGYFDFGIMGRASHRRSSLLKIVYGISQQDLFTASRNFFGYAKKMLEDEIKLFKQKDRVTYNKFIKAIEKVEEIIVDNFRVELEELFSPWYEAREKNIGEKDYEYKKSGSYVFSKMLFKAGKYDVSLPKEVIIFFRTVIVSDTVASKLDPNFDMIEAMKEFFKDHPVTEVEEQIKSRSHEEELEEDLDIVSHLNFDQLLELKAEEKERLGLARERLMEMVTYYAEEYSEVRQLLK